MTESYEKWVLTFSWVQTETLLYTIRGSKSSMLIFLTALTANALAKHDHKANLDECM
jgi:hypothetical protein